MNQIFFYNNFNKKIKKKGARPNTLHLSRVHKQCNRISHINGTHPTLSAQELSGRFWIFNGQSVRKFTLLACFRLMGFADSYQKIGSLSCQYKQIGNSVPIPLIEQIADKIFTFLKDGGSVCNEQKLKLEITN
eukprot:TRINITY_DN39248_c0_g1_i2.p1 TRINITY_DN39248_c0_g1~~TRINITY_DN39248_c0_g1_i2.p1  ORF type:complete len:133 (-),score=1.70 TRINITY_DN39248_c0_g1_i2:176-574(-)